MTARIDPNAARALVESTVGNFAQALNKAFANRPRCLDRPNREGFSHDGAHSFNVKHEKKSGADVVTVTGSSGSDNLVVNRTVNGYLAITDLTTGDTYYVQAKNNTRIEVDGGGGNDTIDASDTRGNCGYSVSLKGGAGNDKLIGGTGRDYLEGGTGRDYLEGGTGDDVLIGGDGKDVLYGLGGNDTLDGGAGDDYLDCGEGNDIGHGGAGKDIVSGGRGDDVLYGDSGRDVLIASFGHDTLVDGGDNDRFFAKQGDNVQAHGSSMRVNVDPGASYNGKPLGSSIAIDGSDEFKARVASDLDTMRGLPLGQSMLRKLDESGHMTIIREGNTDRADPVSKNNISPDKDGRPGTGSDVAITYNPSYITLGDLSPVWRDIPPMVALFHEMGHAVDFEYGVAPDSLSPNPGGQKAPFEDKPITRSEERAVVGLPYDQNGDGVNDPNHRLTTENGMRDQLGLPRRGYY